MGVDKTTVVLWAAAAAGAVWYLTNNSQDGEDLQTPSPLQGMLTNTGSSTVYPGMALTSNESAFLATIAQSEGAGGSNGYSILYGGSVWPGDLSTHPALQGWAGVTLTPTQCAGAGFSAGCVSTAAGRYQINRPTFANLQSALGTSDFQPATQDVMALELIRQHGALDLVNAGQISQAIALIAPVWASLPGANYAGQNSNSLSSLLSTFESIGGALVS